jgi:WD40 repeat protein
VAADRSHHHQVGAAVEVAMLIRHVTISLMALLGMSELLFGQPPKTPAWPPINPAQARLDQTLGGLDGPCHAIVVNEGAELLVVAGEHGNLLSWPRPAWMGVRVGTAAPDAMPAHDGPITALAAAAGSVIATAGADRKIHLWSLPGREAKLTLDTGQMVRALAISPDGKRLAAGDDSGAIHLFDLPEGKAAGKLTGHTDWILSVAFSPDGTRLASGGQDGQILLWELPGAKKLLAFSFRPAPAPNTPVPPIVPITATCFRPDGKALAAGDSAGQIHLLNPIDGKLIRTMQSGHASAVSGLAFHPSGSVLASSGKDRVIKLWNPDNGQALANLEGHTSWVQGVVFLEKGTRLASVSTDQTVRVWDLTPKK